MSASDQIVRLLLRWYAQNARDLPWRRTADPYAIWISEVMLQQTRVDTVIPYWNRWMTALPDVRALARAPIARVLKRWEGLGYYTRAQNLQRAAKTVVARHEGRFPNRYEDVLALPGVGRYTAGAVCSIAFNQAVPILDGNVIRVLTRLFGIAGNVRGARVKERLWELSRQLVAIAAGLSNRQVRSCSNLNQALMELGATVCGARLPKCNVCPVRALCSAHQTDRTHRLPNRSRRVSSVPRQFAAFIACHQRRVLVVQRPSGIVNAHLWEFPNVETTGNTADPKEWAQVCLGCATQTLSHFLTVHHSITRYRIRLDAYHLTVADRADVSAIQRQAPGIWCTARQLEKLAFPSAHRKLLRQFHKTVA